MPCRYSGAGKMNRSLLRMALTTSRPTVIGSCGRAQNGPASPVAAGRCGGRAPAGRGAPAGCAAAGGGCVAQRFRPVRSRSAPMLVCVMPGISVDVPMLVARSSWRSCSIKPAGRDLRHRVDAHGQCPRSMPLVEVVVTMWQPSLGARACAARRCLQPYTGPQKLTPMPQSQSL